MTSPSSLETLTIGAVSVATGVPVNTLRTWERRYGFPHPLRSDSGQRLYSPNAVAHLRLVAQALSLGHRPRQVMGLSQERLQSLLRQTAPSAPPPRPATASPAPHGAAVASWLSATRQLDGDALRAGLHSTLSGVGLMPFLQQHVVPFLDEVGRAWRAGDLRIYEEHFASERLAEFLAGTWRPMSDVAHGRPVVCGILPGEGHALGLHMAACVLALHGRRVVFLGRAAPVNDLLDCVQASGATTLMLSLSANTDWSLATRALRELRSSLPKDVTLVCGGDGAPRGLQGVIRLTDLGELESWISSA